MNRNDILTIVLRLTALLGVLAVAVPASAMNDPVTGRWMTRDSRSTHVAAALPVAENHSRAAWFAPPETMIGRSQLQPLLQRRPGVSSVERVNLYLWLLANPYRLQDPSGDEAVWVDCRTYEQSTPCHGFIPELSFAFAQCCDEECGAYIPLFGEGSSWNDPTVITCTATHECAHCRHYAQYAFDGIACTCDEQGLTPDGQDPRSWNMDEPDEPNPSECEAYLVELLCYAIHGCSTRGCEIERCRAGYRALYYCGQVSSMPEPWEWLQAMEAKCEDE